MGKLKFGKVFFTLCILLSFISCKSLQFGKQGELDLFQEEEHSLPNQIEEFDLTYHFRLGSLDISGKTVVENTFVYQEDLFFCISFPRIGIIKTSDMGKNYHSSFFKLRYLEEAYGYEKEENEQEETETDISQKRIYTHFAASPKDPNQLYISIGPYLFISNDRGLTWKENQVFMDLDNGHIRQIIITKEGQVLLFSDYMMAISNGKKWIKKRYLKKSYQYQFISAGYDEQAGELFISLKSKNESKELNIYISRKYI